MTRVPSGDHTGLFDSISFDQFPYTEKETQNVIMFMYIHNLWAEATQVSVIIYNYI